MYAVIPMQASARIIYTDDLCEAMAIYSDIAQGGQPVALAIKWGKLHHGNDKPIDSYFAIQQANT